MEALPTCKPALPQDTEEPPAFPAAPSPIPRLPQTYMQRPQASLLVICCPSGAALKGLDCLPPPTELPARIAKGKVAQLHASRQWLETGCVGTRAIWLALNCLMRDARCNRHSGGTRKANSCPPGKDLRCQSMIISLYKDPPAGEGA